MRRVASTTALMLGVCALTGAHAGPAPKAVVLSQKRAEALVNALLVPSPYKLGFDARNGHIRYRIAFDRSGAYINGATASPPETGEQRVTEIDGVFQLDICSGCGNEPAPTAAELQHYRTATDWIESDDPAVRKFAMRHGRSRDLVRRMQKLSRAVRLQITKIDFRRYESAAQALASRRGDCTETALLLAAAARVHGIPARIVHGIAYSSRFTGKSHVFSPHSWVQVWDGTRWRSFDAGLERFDAGHIALAIGDGSPNEGATVNRMIRRLRIVSAVGIAPAVAAKSPASAENPEQSSAPR